jgi:hypothetical protein
MHKIVVHSLRHLEYQFQMIKSPDVVLTSHPLMRVETFESLVTNFHVTLFLMPFGKKSFYSWAIFCL